MSQASVPAVCRIVALGTPDVLGADGRSLSSILAQPRRLALLTFLVHAGHPLTRTALLDIFWPNAPERRARNALSQALHFLGKAVGTGLIRRRGNEMLGIRPRDVFYDVRALEEGSHDPSPSTLALYRGPFLDGISLNGANNLQGWRDGVRARLSRVARDVAVALADDAERRGRLASALDFAARGTSAAPLDEATACLHVRLLARNGHRTDALQEAELFRTRLAGEVDLRPSSAFEKLLDDIRSA